VQQRAILKQGSWAQGQEDGSLEPNMDVAGVEGRLVIAQIGNAQVLSVGDLVITEWVCC
jgi:hypothetical protein